MLAGNMDEARRNVSNIAKRPVLLKVKVDWPARLAIFGKFQ